MGRLETSSTPPDGLDQLDPLLQHRSRLGALVLLSRVEAMNFSRLERISRTTSGGASVSAYFETQSTISTSTGARSMPLAVRR